jgi:hypothetical protein
LPHFEERIVVCQQKRQITRETAQMLIEQVEDHIEMSHASPAMTDVKKCYTTIL